jgi:RHS repeat-associated protein
MLTCTRDNFRRRQRPGAHARRSPTALPLLCALVLASSAALAAGTANAAATGSAFALQASGCGITMSCAPASDDKDIDPDTPTPTPDQCVTNNAGNTCGAQGGPASQPSPTGQDVGAGNPLDLMSGNKYQQEVDLPALPGVLGLEIVRHYNSHRARRGERSALGSGWRLSYDTSLRIGSDRLEIIQADGARVIFARDPQRPQRCASTDPGRGEIRIKQAAGGEEYVWHWPQGRRLHFDAAGRLIQILAPSGEFVSLRRSPEGRLLQVTDPQGRSLHLHYHGAGSPFPGIAHIDSPLGRFSYAQAAMAHSGPGPAGRHVAKAQHATVNLTEVTYPAADARATLPARTAARTYHYEDVRHPAALTGITITATGGEGAPVRERIASYAYDASGRGVRSVRGPMPGEGESGVEDVRLAFPARGRSVLTNSLGQRTTYLSAVIGGQRRILEARGPGCARCGLTDVRYRYAANGRLSAVTTLDTEGRPLRSIQHHLDDHGRIVETLEADLSGARPQLLDRVRHVYATDTPGNAGANDRTDPAAPTLTSPVAIVRASVVGGREHRIELRYNTAGQLEEVHESGFSPVAADGARTPTPIERRIRYRYTRINGRSVLAEIDRAPHNSPAPAAANAITRLHWDARGSFIVALEQPGGRRSEIEHDPVTGLPRRVRNEDGHETQLRHDSALHPVEWRNLDPGTSTARVHQAEYDPRGHLVALRTGAGAHARPLWRRAYDSAGRLQWHADAHGTARLFTHDSESRLIATTLRSASFARQRTWRHDEAGRVEAITDNTGFQRHLRRDKGGKLIGVTDSHGRERLRPAALDAISAHAPGVDAAAVPVRAHTQVLHDDFGRPVWAYSPDHGATLRSFDAADRLVAMRDAVGHQARYAYDARGRILEQTVTDAGTGAVLVTRWRYDGARLREIDHPTQRERFEYDARGLRRARIVTLKTAADEPSIITRYEHDSAARLVTTTLPDGSLLRHTYNGQGRIVALHRQPVRTPWLRWLAREQVIAAGFERDLFGLRSFQSGNGIHTLLQRSREGALQRVTHGRTEDANVTRVARSPARWLPLRAGQALGQRIEELLGIRPAHAASPDTPPPLIDHRYVWDPEGKLLHQRDSAPLDALPQVQRSYAYDQDDHLVASVEWAADGERLHESAVWRYAYDHGQRRVLAQQGAPDQDALHAKVARARFAIGTHRVAGWERLTAEPAPPPQAPARYNANGQPVRLGGHEYQWDALGRLVTVDAHGRALARYAYDHRGLRITRTRLDAPDGAAQTTHMLYDDARQPLAELDADGTITRQYLWLADLPLAVLDLPTRLADEADGLRRIIEDLGRAVHSWFAPHEGLTWLHTNHLGAPELATDGDGRPVWRARYAPFGAATITPAPAQRAFTLALRLPGQLHDPETGLHYNRQRYYDPDRGEYLTPDPLGTPDGPNPYAYVAFNPLGAVDPDGLVLFAFDGTGNSDDLNDPAMRGNGLSNVVHFFDAYSDQKRYVSGVGTVHRDPHYGDIRPDDHARYRLLWWLTPGDPAYVNDMGANNSGPARIDRMMSYMGDEAELARNDQIMDVDIIGFSRGAAQAREFANRIVENSFEHEGVTYYVYLTRSGDSACQPVNFRFMGLFDTVLSTNLSWTPYNLDIPGEFAHVAQAVALNEHRSGSAQEFSYRTPRPHRMHWGGFPLESIGAGSATPGQIRIERGFIGAHADIGGGYPDDEQGLSLVALNWMVKEARRAGLTIKTIDPIPDHDVVLHDQSNAIQAGDPQNVVPRTVRSGDLVETEHVFPEDREVNGATAGSVQRDMRFDNGSMTHAATRGFITWLPRDIAQQGTGSALDPRTLGDVTATVNMQAYLQWLCAHNYFGDASPQCS